MIPIKGHDIDVFLKFWESKADGKIEIDQEKLYRLLEYKGFGLYEFSRGKTSLVQMKHNIINEVTRRDLITCINQVLDVTRNKKVKKAFIKGSSTFLNQGKYDFLPLFKKVNDKDPVDEAWTYYLNSAVKVTKGQIKLIPYENIQHPIWGNRILDREFHIPNKEDSQFEDFVGKLSKLDPKRIKSLQSILGYLQHRYHDVKASKAIILLDENASYDGSANGGTGKSLIADAISRRKELVILDGKNYKPDSRFMFQRVEETTDIINIDDVKENFDLESFFSNVTNGIPVERKGEHERFISKDRLPKFLISSNFSLRFRPGVSDARRRFEFEVANYFNLKRTPYLEYGNRFFYDWDDEEWNKFDFFMMKCTQKYLQKGLIPADPINIKNRRLISSTSVEFSVFIKLDLIDLNTWYIKDDILKLFKSEFPNLQDLSPHRMTKWLREYSSQNNLMYEDRKSGEKYEFRLVDFGKEASNEE